MNPFIPKKEQTKGDTIVNRLAQRRVHQILLLMVCSGVASALWADRTTTYTYDSNGNVLTMNGPRTDVNDTTTYTYDASGNRATMTNALNQVTQYTSYDANGRLLSMTDANGVISSMTYDARGRLKTRTIDSATTTFDYDPVGNLTRVTLPNGSYLDYIYDAARRLTDILDNQGNKISYTLDNQGNRTKEEVFDSNEVLRRTLSRQFDALSRMTQLIGGTNPTQQITMYGYDLNGNQSSITEPGKSSALSNYDALNRLIEQIDPTGEDTDYGYDARDNLTSVTDARGLTTSYQYDGLDNLKQLNSPDTGVTNYTYDDAGNRLTQTDARGITTTYQYDALNRVTSITYPTASLNVGFTYDQGAYGKGRLTGMTDSSGSTTYSYDAKGNLTQQAVTINSVIYTTDYAYDNADNLTQITYPSGRTVTYTLNNIGQVVQVETNDGSGNVIVASNITYLPFGPMDTMTLGNGISTNADYDLDYRTTLLQAGTILDRSVGYDLVSNINAITDAVNTANNQSFTYDALDRLKTANGSYGAFTYTYDVVGNRLTQANSPQSDSYNYSATSNRLDNITGSNADTFGYDNVGNIISTSNETINYADHNRMVSYTGTQSATYTYNGKGERISKTISGTTTLYHYDSNGRLITETDNSGDTLREYFYLNGQLLVMEAKEQITVGGDEIIVDNGSGATSTTGTWTVKGNGPSYGADYELANSNNTPSTYRWTPTLTAGDYEVYAWWVSSGGYSNNVPYTIAHNGQTATVNRSHKSGGGQWDLLGIWTFDGSGSEYIEISNANGKASADGIRLVKALSTVTQVNRYYVHNDHLGTPQSVTNDSGDEVWRADYRPFGEPTINADVDGDANLLVMNVRFPGQYFDAESGNHYNYFRDYDTSTGRYLQSDPIGLGGGINTYSYALQNSIRYFDPNGAMPCEQFDYDCQNKRDVPFPFPKSQYPVHPYSDEHTNRNVNNRCPKKQPQSCGTEDAISDHAGIIWEKDNPVSSSLFHGYLKGYRTYRNPLDGSQCTYDNNGNLIDEGPYMGTHDKGRAGTKDHVDRDVKPHQVNPNYTPGLTITY